MNYVCNTCQEPVTSEDWDFHVCPSTGQRPVPTTVGPLANTVLCSVPNNTNPKDLLGAKKVSFTKVPASAIAHAAHAMMNGADKYGSFNWREKNVQAGIYIDAAMRHLLLWFEGEEVAEDSGVHHLGHAMACCAILLDAQENRNLVDDRPKSSDLNKVFERISQSIQKRKA